MPFPLDVRYVRQAEAKLGHALPTAYVARICQRNGGEISSDDDDWTLHPIRDDGDRKRLARTCNDVLRETAAAQLWRGFPVDAISIASNGAGDHLVLLVDATGSGYSDVVYRWNHETGDLKKVADEVSQFD